MEKIFDAQADSFVRGAMRETSGIVCAPCDLACACLKDSDLYFG